MWSRFNCNVPQDILGSLGWKGKQPNGQFGCLAWVGILNLAPLDCDKLTLTH